MQSAKIIDVTRSFVPVNPNAYPETLHGTFREDSPESRIPVVPYRGVNFLPTSYGYMSYFGTRFPLDINSLLPNKVGHLFIYQTLTFKNILIALCDTGIWYKDSTIDGDWAQAAVITPVDEDIYFEWTWCFINNVLYVYYTNADRYYKIETAADLVLHPVGATLTEVVQDDVTFITLNAQLGMFRLSNRIAFWDGANAISWSSPDDFTDFKPAVISGVNVTKFSSVLGGISAIRSHGSDAIIYATKSVVLLEVSALETFLVKARPILNNVGVAYMKQSVEGVPNTIHFCFSDSGIYKIEKSVPELIVPQVWDYFKEYTPTPIYLRMLEGRYLCFETTDVNVINGEAQFKKTTLPPVNLTFKGTQPGHADPLLEDVHDLDPDPIPPATLPLCNVIANLDAGNYAEQKADSQAKVPNNLRQPGTNLTPIWTCYIANNGVKDLSNLDWIETPCGAVGPKGTHFKMNPSLGSSLDKMTTTTANKTASTGKDAWTDGKWTMERFIQVQTAIWDAEAKVAKALVNAILRRNFTENKQTQHTSGCVIAAPSTASCNIGDYVTDFSDPQFGFNRCSFWLTRYALDKTFIKNKKTTSTTCVTPDPILIPPSGYRIGGSSGPDPASPVFGSVDAVKAYAETLYLPSVVVLTPTDPTSSSGANVSGFTSAYEIASFLIRTGTTYDYAAYWHWDAPAGQHLESAGSAIPPTPAPVALVYDTGQTDKMENFKTFNTGEASGPGVWGVETAFCVISGYEYTDTNGNKQRATALACTDTNDKYPGAIAPTRVVPQTPKRENPIQHDGNFCGLPYDSPIDPALDPPIPWSDGPTDGTPDEIVGYPEYNFLLQQGSIAPRYPTFQGSFVYDLALKKWGKLKAEYKQLLDYSPLNSSSSSTINFANFGIVAGLIKEDGFIYLFDNKPQESYLTWGKVGYYRLGVTDAQEVRVDFKTRGTGILRIDTSTPDGTAIADGLSTDAFFVAATTVTCYPKFNGKWYNISLLGNFDVAFMEFRGMQKGRR